MAKRQALTKKARFEIFKRDGFSCQYCGATPPSVVLQVDHIVSVAKGGTNADHNLTTSCQPCNLGKMTTPLGIVPKSLSERAKETKEREDQLLAYQDIMQCKVDRIEDEAWKIAEFLFPSNRHGPTLTKQDFLSIKRFIKTLGVFQVAEAAEIAAAKHNYSSSRFRYFCGICWNWIKEPQNGSV